MCVCVRVYVCAHVCVCVCVCAGYCSATPTEKSGATNWVNAQRALRSMPEGQGSMKDAHYQHGEEVLECLGGASKETCNAWFNSAENPRSKTTATIRLAVRLALSGFCLVQMGVTSFK